MLCGETPAHYWTLTWHDDKGSLGLHGNQTGTEDAGGVGGRDAAHPAGLLQTFAERLEVPPAQQNAPIWERQRQFITSSRFDAGRKLVRRGKTFHQIKRKMAKFGSLAPPTET